MDPNEARRKLIEDSLADIEPGVEGEEE